MIVVAWAASLALAGPAVGAPRNLVIFVTDGLRAGIVTRETAPELAALRDEGVNFVNSHSLFPTVTTANASAIATGHYLGDTGDFGNLIYTGAALAQIENDASVGQLNARYDGRFLGEAGLLEAARAKGYATAAIGKLGPVAVQDVTSRDGRGGIVIDDATGGEPGSGLGLSPDVEAAIRAAGLPVRTAGRGANAGSSVLAPNTEQQAWFLAVATRVLLPKWKAEGKPFVLVYWSRDPDGTQHTHGDSAGALTPGINGPTSMAAIANASANLGALRRALADLGLADNTNIVVTADHGFATKATDSRTSGSAIGGRLPRGFLAADLSRALDLPLYDAAGARLDAAKGQLPLDGARLGADPMHPDVVVAPNAGSSLLYLPGPTAKALAPKVVRALASQDYTGAIFVADDLGPIPGALPTSRINLRGASKTPSPSIVVGFRSWDTGCGQPELCAVEVSDSSQQYGQGVHGAFGRHDTHNFMAAAGPDFRRGFRDPAPVSNADWAPTLAKLMGLEMPARGVLKGRVMREALAADGAPTSARSWTVRSAPGPDGFVTILNGQTAGGATYFDAAGAPGRTVGLKP